MFKSLKLQLMISGVASLALLLLAVWLITRHYIYTAVAVLVIVCMYIILLILWFWRYVTDPIERLTRFAAHIAQGSYGARIEAGGDDEIGRLTDEINNMSEKVALADKARTDFISQVSHELRTPLTAITGWAETIAYDEAVQGDSLRGINIISREAERLTGMVKELLEFTRIQDGRFNLNLEAIDLPAEVEDVLFTYSSLLAQEGVSIRYDCDEETIPPIQADPERIKQVLLNVLDNAVKYGKSGGTVEVSVQSDSDSVIITTRDHGPGIPENELPHVKERFYKGSSKERGSGIGLAVCEEIVTRHGGTLTIENHPEGGVLATVKLPITQ